MMKKTLTLLIVAVFIPACVSVGYSKDKPKTYKLKGMMVVHPETKDIKVVDKNYEYHTIYYNKKTKVTATVKAKTSDLEKEMSQSRLPKGTVTYIIKDGKKIATKVSFKSRAGWGLKKKKKKKK
jgi:hypothetical protein